MSERSIKQAAAELGVSAHTLRFYEKVGVLEVQRNSSGHRRYTDREIRLIHFALRLRATSMPLENVRQYVSLVREDSAPEVRLQLLLDHLERIDSNMCALVEAKGLLERKITLYHKVLLSD